MVIAKCKVKGCNNDLTTYEDICDECWTNLKSKCRFAGIFGGAYGNYIEIFLPLPPHGIIGEITSEKKIIPRRRVE